MIRLEVTEGRPLRTTVAYIDTDVPPALGAQLRPIVDQAVARAATAANLIPRDAALLMAGELAKLRADDEAYERVCAQRGVLAL